MNGGPDERIIDEAVAGGTRAEPRPPVLHIAEARVWEAASAVGEYRFSTGGRSLAEVGFIHCSHRHQVERVANAVYRGTDQLVLLTIDPDRVGSEVKEEPVEGVERFPHLYGPFPLTPWWQFGL